MVAAAALPTKGLVIGVLVAIRQRVVKLCGSDSVETRLESDMTRHGWDLNRQARVALVALVVTTRWGRA